MTSRLSSPLQQGRDQGALRLGKLAPGLQRMIESVWVRRWQLARTGALTPQRKRSLRNETRDTNQ